MLDGQTGWPNKESARLQFWEIEESEPYGFECWSSETNDVKIDNCHFLARCSALSRLAKDSLAQCPDNVTEWDIRACCWNWFPSEATI